MTFSLPIAGAASWLALFCLYLRCVPGTFYFEDSPELIACAAHLGNTHPPGYPLLMLLGRLVFMLPVGAPAFRFNLMVASCGAGAAVVMGCFVARLVPGWGEGVNTRVRGLWPAVFMGGTWALSDAFWWQSVIGDKYALYYLAFAGMLLCAARAIHAPLPRLGRAFACLGMVSGLAFAHHHYAAFALPAVAAAVWRVVADGKRARYIRVVAMAGCLGFLPFSVRLLYPPMRSAAAVELDWGRPCRAGQFGRYLTGRLYHEAFLSASLPVNPRQVRERFGLAFRLLKEEIPLPLLAGLPFGVAAAAGSHPLLAAGVSACFLANAGYAVNFSEKVVRWYEPSYAILLAVSALGFAWIANRLRRGRAWWLAGLALMGTAVQFERGLGRNDLSSFTAAHDLGRNLLRSLPPRSLYLGAGDLDLFPLWEMRVVEGEREDVESVGLGSFVDPQLAGVGGLERLCARYGSRTAGPEFLRFLLTSPSAPPVMVAAAGYDRKLHELMPFLKACRLSGIAGRLIKRWDAYGSAAGTFRVVRGYTFRGLRYARSGAVFDQDRLRDEIARGALIVYPSSFATLGALCLHFGLEREAARAFALARGQMEALAGPLSPPRMPVWRPPVVAAAEEDRSAVVLGFHRLADAFERRGVRFMAEQLRANAVALAQ